MNKHLVHAAMTFMALMIAPIFVFFASISIHEAANANSFLIGFCWSALANFHIIVLFGMGHLVFGPSRRHEAS